MTRLDESDEYTCPFCSCVPVGRDSFDRHLRTIHQQTCHVCDVCSKGFYNHEKLTRHKNGKKCKGKQSLFDSSNTMQFVSLFSDYYTSSAETNEDVSHETETDQQQEFIEMPEPIRDDNTAEFPCVICRCLCHSYEEVSLYLSYYSAMVIFFKIIEKKCFLETY